jgi:hypothetical protein
MNSALEAAKATQDGLQARIWTAMPATVVSYDPVNITVTAQATIQIPVRQPDGSWVNTTLSVCGDCPVMWQGGGGYVTSHPLQEGDEGLLVFAARCIDAWWQSGGVQPQAEQRMHDLSDGFFIPICFSQPNIPGGGGLSTTGVETRSVDGTSMTHFEKTKWLASLNNGRTSLTVDDGAQKVSVTAVDGLWVNGIQVSVP